MLFSEYISSKSSPSQVPCCQELLTVLLQLCAVFDISAQIVDFSMPLVQFSQISLAQSSLLSFSQFCFPKFIKLSSVSSRELSKMCVTSLRIYCFLGYKNLMINCFLGYRNPRIYCFWVTEILRSTVFCVAKILGSTVFWVINIFLKPLSAFI